MRIDKFLWSVRIFKTRAMASDACKSGRVKINGKAVKAAKEARKDQVITTTRGVASITCTVIEIPHSRVGPPLVEQYAKVEVDGGELANTGNILRVNTHKDGDRHEKEERKISSRKRKAISNRKVWS